MSCPAVQSTQSETLRLSCPCDISAVRPVTSNAINFLTDRGVSEADLQSCELALVEACNNAIHYAGEKARLEAVAVEIDCSPEEIVLRVWDHTAGFNLPETMDLPEPEQESGRGLFLISSMMDRVRYLRGGADNVLCMSKRRTGDPGAPANPGMDEVNRKLVESEQIIRDMAEELSFCYESLSAIFRCSAELGRTNNLEEFSQRLLMDLSQITSADWFVLRLVSKEGSRLAVFAASEPGWLLLPLELVSGQPGASAELEAALSRQDIWFDEQRQLEPKDPLGRAKPGSIGLIHPIFLGDTLIGTLTIGKKAGLPHFTAVHANVIHTFADFLAIQIVNARYQEEQVNSRVFSRELEIARNIQRSLLPKSLPLVPGFTLAGFCESARQVGGDFYDVLRITEDSLLLIIADVMGKGIPAAIFAAILRSVLRAVPEWTSEPAALLTRANRLLFEELSGVDMFITAQLIYVDMRQRRFVAASAGHCPTLLALGRTGPVKAIAPEGLPLGILPDTVYSNQEEQLGDDSTVLLYTDGLTEARNARGEFFGQERLMHWLQASLKRHETAEALKDDLAAELSHFQANGSLNDDQTFLILAR